MFGGSATKYAAREAAVRVANQLNEDDQKLSDEDGEPRSLMARVVHIKEDNSGYFGDGGYYLVKCFDEDGELAGVFSGNHTGALSDLTRGEWA